MKKQTSEEKRFNTFIGSIPGSCSKEDLENLLGKYTKVQKLRLATKKNREGKLYCLGFGFALLEKDPEEAGLIDPKPPIKLHGRVIKIKKNLEGNDREKYRLEMAEKRLFVLNIPKGSTNEELLQFFNTFGAVDSTSIIKETAKGQTTHFGYVVFKSKEIAKKLLKSKTPLKFKNNSLKLKPFKSRMLENSKISPKNNFSNYSDDGRESSQKNQFCDSPKKKKSKRKQNSQPQKFPKCSKKGKNQPQGSKAGVNVRFKRQGDENQKKVKANFPQSIFLEGSKVAIKAEELYHSQPTAKEYFKMYPKPPTFQFNDCQHDTLPKSDFNKHKKLRILQEVKLNHNNYNLKFREAESPPRRGLWVKTEKKFKLAKSFQYFSS